MVSDSEAARQLSRYLLQIQAVKLQIQNPFQWASGWLSPIYCDNRKTLSHPKIRIFIKNHLAEIIRNQYPDVNIIAGVATGAIAIAALVADDMELPMVYVRSSSKAHGLGNQIEGDLTQGNKVVVVEDLVSTGMSSLNAVKSLRESGLEVLGMVSIFTYGFQQARDNFIKEDCWLNSLSDYATLISVAVEDGFIQAHQAATLEEWRNNPENWNVK